MPAIPELIAYSFVNILPPLVLALLPFRESLRLPGKWVVGLALVLCALDALTSYFAFVYDVAGAMTVLSMFLYLGFYLTAVRASPLKLLTVLLILMNFTNLATITSDFFMNCISPQLSWDPYTWDCILLFAAGQALSFPFYCWLLDRRIRPQVTAGHAERFWRYLWVAPATFYVVFYFVIFNAGGPAQFAASWSNVLFMWLVSAGALLITDMMARLLEEGRKNLRLQRDNSELALQIAQYESLKSSIEQTRRARHDLQQHLQAIQGYIESGDMEKLAAYVTRYGVSLPPESVRTFCKNHAIDAVLRYYAEKAIQEGVDLSVSFQMDEQAVIPEPELCVVIGNLLENALEACSASEGERFIRINARQIGGSMLSLTVDNTSTRPPVVEGGRLRSSKRDGFGIGTESVQAIAKRFHGDARFAWRNNTFYASVMFNP